MRRMLLRTLICLSLCLALGGCAASGASFASEGSTQLLALNVGKADCLLLFTCGKTYLIDAGYDYTFGTLREALRQYGVTHLDGVFLTHCDKDHYGGLMQLSQSDLSVGAWYAAAIYHDVKSGQHPMEQAAALRGESVVYLNAGDEIAIAPDACLRVLGPLVANTENENNNSLILYVQTPDGSLLLTGDMKLEEERTLLEENAVTHADVLKVAFHGDNTSSSSSFLEKVSPSAAVICTSSEQEPDTPSSSVLRRLGLLGVQCAVTQDYDRGVLVTLSGGNASISDVSWTLPDYSACVRAAISVENDVLTLRNSSSEDIALGGWIVYSTRGETCIPLPDDAVLPANGVFKLGTRETEADVTLKMDIKRLWHKSRLDQAIIYDASGCVVAVTDNSLPE